MYTFIMTDQVAPAPHQMLLELSEKARSYGINPDRPFFPVNSLRLFYYIVLDELTGSAEAISKMSDVIPKIEAVLAARAQTLDGSSPLKDLEHVSAPLRDLFQAFPAPALERVFAELFGTLLPFHDQQLVSIHQQLQGSAKITPEALPQLLATRSLDSIVLSTYILEIAQSYSVTPLEGDELLKLSTYLHYQIHLLYQLNDIVDAVVFAKDDMTNQSYSLLGIVQKIATTTQEITALIHRVAQRISEDSERVTHSKLSKHIELFRVALIQVIY
jgi:hypothetical protein